MTMKNDTKLEEELTCRFKTDKRHLTNFDLITQKSLKICALMGSFWSKYIMFELKNCRGVIFDGTEDWCKILKKTDLSFPKWHGKFVKFLFTGWKIGISF